MILRHLGWLALLATSSFWAGMSKAQPLEIGNGSPDLRMGVTVTFSSDSARPVQCPLSRQVTCFRIFAELRSNDNRVHNVAMNILPGSTSLAQSFAYLSDGALCQAHADMSLPQVEYNPNQNVGKVLPDAPITISGEQPFAFPITFACDRPVETGDTAQVQISVGVGAGAYIGGSEVARIIHFTWPRVTIAARTVR